MEPKTKVVGLALSFTVLCIFFALNTLVPALHLANLNAKLATAAIAVFASAGLYQSLVTGMVAILVRVPLAKKSLFAGYFLEGTWVGYYQEGNYMCYLVETFEQDLDNIIIRGSSYNMEFERHAQWTSDAVTFDATKGVLSYSYTCHIIPNKTVDQGIAFFSLVRDRSSKPASHLYGYSTDVKDGTRTASWERKIGDVGIRPEDALNIAVKDKEKLDQLRKLT